MSERQVSAESVTERGTESGFVWHPIYAGKSVAEVRSSLHEDIRRDQRSYGLAMEAAETAEIDSFTTVIELERRWSQFDFDWAEMDPVVLGDRILGFEQSREAAQEMITFDQYRSTGQLVADPTPVAASQVRTLPIMKIGMVILLILVLIFIAAVVL